MADSSLKRLRVLHLVGADYHTTPHPLLLPLLTRGKREHVESQAVHFVPGAPQFAVVRQTGLPVHDVALSAKRFSLSAMSDLKKIVKEFEPDLLHAWGTSAQPAAAMLVGRGKDSTLPMVWSVARTTPLSSKPGLIEKTVFNLNKRYAKDCRRIVYSSAAAAAQHRRAGIDDSGSMVIASGVDATRYKPDLQARQRVRQHLELPKDAILIGMYGPYQPEFDHPTFIKAVGELTRVNPNVYCVMAGRAMVRGNAPLMSVVGGGTLGTRTRVIGEWSDLGALFNACDVVCTSATVDSSRLMLATAMLCGVLCVGTSVGAQGEVIGNFGASVEQGSVDALVRGLRRIIDMPPERKLFMMREARKHILQNFNLVRSIERYHELYFEIVRGKVPEGIVTPIAVETDVIMSLPEPVKAAAPEPVASSQTETQLASKQSPTHVPHVPTQVPTHLPKQVSNPPTEARSSTSKPTLQVVAEPVVETQLPKPRVAPPVVDTPFEIDLEKATPVGKIQHSVVDNVMEWSDAEAELISAVIVKDAPAASAAAPAATTQLKSAEPQKIETQIELQKAEPKKTEALATVAAASDQAKDKGKDVAA